MKHPNRYVVADKPFPERILLITDDFKPNVGGIAEMLDSLASAWTHMGIHVTVLTSCRCSDADEAQYMRLCWHSCPDRFSRPAIPVLGWIIWKTKRFITRKTAWLRWNPIRSHFYRKLTLKCRPDVVIFGVWSPWSKLILDTISDIGIPLVTIVYGAEILIYGQKLKNELMDSLNKNKLLLAISHYTRDLLIKFGISFEILSILPMGVKNIENLPYPVNNSEINFLSNLYKKRIILSVGSLVKRKGFDNVIKALPLVLAQTGRDIAYVIAGSGPDRERLESLANEYGVEDFVFFAGTITDNLKAELYRKCEFLIMPSRVEPDGSVEGFGIVFLEANLFAKATIGGNSGGVPDAVKDGQTGILVDPINPDEIGNVILKLLNNHDLRRKLGRQGREDILNKHLWPYCAQQICSMLSFCFSNDQEPKRDLK